METTTEKYSVKGIVKEILNDAEGIFKYSNATFCARRLLTAHFSKIVYAKKGATKAVAKFDKDYRYYFRLFKTWTTQEEREKFAKILTGEEIKDFIHS